MKSTFKEEKTQFKSVILEITLETLEELQALYFISLLQAKDVHSTLINTSSIYRDKLHSVNGLCNMILDDLHDTIIKKYPELGLVE